MNEHVVAIPEAVLLFDGECGLCAATARWLERRVGPEALRTMALDLAPRDARIRDAVGGRNLAASLHVVRRDGTVRTGAAAVLAAGRLVPRWRWLALLVDHRAGHALLEPAYRLVARNRHRIGRALGLPSACVLPPAPRRG